MSHLGYESKDFDFGITMLKVLFFIYKFDYKQLSSLYAFGSGVDTEVVFDSMLFNVCKTYVKLRTHKAFNLSHRLDIFCCIGKYRTRLKAE